ncbi:MAG: hypothetical protein LBK62_05985, partial [Treponema sp.]|nr:hypothetical protein [Treponema sp.]
YTWNGLAGGVTYTFTVKAVDHSGNRSEGVSVSGTTYDTTPAGPVTGLEGIPGDGNVVLTWTDPGDADLAYIQIECNEIPGPAQNVYPGTGTYTWSALAKGSSYTFTVTTRDTQGNLGAAVTVGPVPVILAGGGTISLVKVEGSSPLKWWEIHTFTTSGALTFPSGYTSVTADYLIVAGGGGAGHSGVYDCAGGGGAGGLLYKTGQTLSLTGSAVTVTVGAGGAANGGNGGTSSIGTAVAPGGGGGGNTDATGKDGGSGGGGGAGAGTLSYSGGKGADTLKATNSLYIDIEGYNGAAGSTGIPGGGGGGAAGMGIVGGSGGAPWNAAAAGAAWIAAAATTNEFSRGGNAAGTGSGGAAGKNYGDGGSGGERGANMDGGAGHGGVVVIRFQRD